METSEQERVARFGSTERFGVAVLVFASCLLAGAIVALGSRHPTVARSPFWAAVVSAPLGIGRSVVGRPSKAESLTATAPAFVDPLPLPATIGATVRRIR